MVTNANILSHFRKKTKTFFTFPVLNHLQTAVCSEKLFYVRCSRHLLGRQSRQTEQELRAAAMQMHFGNSSSALVPPPSFSLSQLLFFSLGSWIARCKMRLTCWIHGYQGCGFPSNSNHIKKVLELSPFLMGHFSYSHKVVNEYDWLSSRRPNTKELLRLFACNLQSSTESRSYLLLNF